jgi:branched-subunit amino acid aminotransferase/4-amino-4-deoxychorismate lyase
MSSPSSFMSLPVLSLETPLTISGQLLHGRNQTRGRSNPPRLRPRSAPNPTALIPAAPLGTGSAKLGGNYAPVFKYAAHAKHAGYPITLHLDSRTRTHIDEFSTSNFVALRKDPVTGVTVFVVPESTSILKSVTTKSLAELAESFGWRVEMRPVPWSEVCFAGRSADGVGWRI